jgi:hypothetical protein
MKFIVCGPLGACVGMALGYAVSYLMFPADTELDSMVRLMLLPRTIFLGGIVGTCIPTCVFVWQEIRGMRASRRYSGKMKLEPYANPKPNDPALAKPTPAGGKA